MVRTTMARKKKQHGGVSIENRRARYDYQLGETIEVGIKLVGTEVKSLRDGRASLVEGYVRAQEHPLELTLHSVTIDEYPPAGGRQHKPTRVRTLLAHKREIQRLVKEVAQRGVTLVPIKLYFKGPWAKLVVAVGTGKRKSDKRQAIAERQSKRDIQRAMSRRV